MNTSYWNQKIHQAGKPLWGNDESRKYWILKRGNSQKWHRQKKIFPSNSNPRPESCYIKQGALKSLNLLQPDYPHKYFPDNRETMFAFCQPWRDEYYCLAFADQSNESHTSLLDLLTHKYQIIISNKYMKARFTLIVAIITIMSAATFSQQTNFSGTWVIREKQHVTGPEYINAMAKQIKVEQAKDSLIIETVTDGGEGKDVTSRQSYALNGKPSFATSTISKRKYTKTLAWSPDKKVLTITTVFSMPENEKETDLTRVETWTLSADGKHLNVDKKSIETRSETWEVKGAFEKV